jgi:hypothetical protein
MRSILMSWCATMAVWDKSSALQPSCRYGAIGDRRSGLRRIALCQSNLGQ